MDFDKMPTHSSCSGRKNRRKNIPTKSSMLNARQLMLVEAASAESMVENALELKPASVMTENDVACDHPEPMDLTFSPVSPHQQHTSHVQKPKRPSNFFSFSPAVAEHPVRWATQLGMHFPVSGLAQMSWLNLLKTERRDEWTSTLQHSLSHVDAAHCKLSETLHLLKKDLPVSNADIAATQTAVQNLLVELGADVQRLAQLQYACCESNSPPPIQSHDDLAQFCIAFPKASSDHNSNQDQSPPLKKAKKDPRCQDDEEANYVDPSWKPITFVRDGIMHVKLSQECDVNLPMSKFEELLKKASCSSTRLLRVLMKHFFTHEQLAAGSLTGEGFYKNKLDESITRAIREIVAQRHPKLKKAKINLCCTDVCVQARRVNENQKRRVSRAPFAEIPFSQQPISSNPSDDATSPDEHCASFDHLSDSPSPGALSLNLSMPDMTTIDPLDVDN